VAVHARVRARGGGDSRTLTEAAPDGWWYAALLPAAELAVAFVTEPRLARRMDLLSPAGFAARLAETRWLSARIGPGALAVLAGPRGADAGSARLDRVSGDGWVAVGDAAISLDPLSSQGILTALFTGLRAGRAIAANLGGQPGALNGYARQIEEIWRAYRSNREACYAAETRWPYRPFWTGRNPAVVRGSHWPRPASPTTR
jgi:2-polyprenyl-6-methoxyphenol hydroxylase-like FAD-dependent oxidoreductase